MSTRKGYYLFPADALNLASVTIVDAHSGATVDLWENGIGGIAGNVKPGHIYRVMLTIGDAIIGWHFASYRFDEGYNYFNQHNAADYGIEL